MKVAELKDLTTEELIQRGDESRREIFNLRLRKSAGQLEKPSRIRELRRDVARINTILNQRAKAATK